MLWSTCGNQPSWHLPEARVAGKLFLRCPQRDDSPVAFRYPSIRAKINRLLHAVRGDNGTSKSFRIFLAGQQKDARAIVSFVLRKLSHGKPNPRIGRVKLHVVWVDLS